MSETGEAKARRARRLAIAQAADRSSCLLTASAVEAAT